MEKMPTKGITLAAIMLFSIFTAFSVSYGYPIQKLLALSRRMGFELRRSIVERRGNKCVDIKI